MKNLKYVTKGFLLHFHIELTTQAFHFSLDHSIEEWCIYWSLGMIFFFPRDFVVCFFVASPIHKCSLHQFFHTIDQNFKLQLRHDSQYHIKSQTNATYEATMWLYVFKTFFFLIVLGYFLPKLIKQNFVVVQTDLTWLYVYPKGIHDLVTHIKNVYNNPPVYITENGKYIVTF